MAKKPKRKKTVLMHGAAGLSGPFMQKVSKTKSVKTAGNKMSKTRVK